MKIIILGNEARSLSNFWKVLIQKIVSKGHEVVCLVPYPQESSLWKEQGKTQQKTKELVWEKSLTAMGATLAYYRLDRKGLNPFRDIHTLRDLFHFFTTEKPDVLFASTIKPVIYGALASAMSKHPQKKDRHLMITGLGYMFEGGSLRKRFLLQLARFLYFLAFSFAGKVYFQNNDDRKLFEKLSIIPSSATVVQTKGTGVRLDEFPVLPFPQEEKVQFLLVGRLLEAKGIREFCEAAYLLSSKYTEAEFCLLGPEETGAGAYPLAEVKKWEKKGCIRYLGETSDVRPYLSKASVIVLPSWREGAPCSLMEAMSSGRPVIAADAPGSRDVVVNKKTGLLVPVGNPISLAKAMEELLLDETKRQEMGIYARKHMEEEFNADDVANELMEQMGIS